MYQNGIEKNVEIIVSKINRFVVLYKDLWEFPHILLH